MYMCMQMSGVGCIFACVYMCVHMGNVVCTLCVWVM